MTQYFTTTSAPDNDPRQQFPRINPGNIGYYPASPPPMLNPGLYESPPFNPVQTPAPYERPVLSPQPSLSGQSNPFAGISWNRGPSHGDWSRRQINMYGLHENNLANAWNQQFMPGSGGLASGNYPGAPNSGSSSGGVPIGHPPSPTSGGTTGAGGSIPSPLRQVLDSYNQAYNNYLTGVEGRYRDTMEGMRGRFDRGVQGAYGLRDDVLNGYENRYQRGMDIVDRFGDQSQRDINEIYDREQAGNLQNLVGRGLTGTTILPTMRLGTERERANALSRDNERRMRERLSADSMLSGDALSAQERQGQNVINTDAQLSGDFLNMMASRNDIPPDLNQLMQLASAAGQSGLGQPSWLDMVRAMGGFGNQGGGFFPGNMGAWNAPFGLMGMPGGGFNPGMVAPNWGASGGVRPRTGGGSGSSGARGGNFSDAWSDMFQGIGSAIGNPFGSSIGNLFNWSGSGQGSGGAAGPGAGSPGSDSSDYRTAMDLWRDAFQGLGSAIADPIGTLTGAYDGIKGLLGRPPTSISEASDALERLMGHPKGPPIGGMDNPSTNWRDFPSSQPPRMSPAAALPGWVPPPQEPVAVGAGWFYDAPTPANDPGQLDAAALKMIDRHAFMKRLGR